MKSLKGKTILLTGATGGFGKEFSRKLLDEGAKLILTSRNEASLNALADEMRGKHLNGEIIALLSADISNFDGCNALFEKVRATGAAVDILINNAGILTYGHFHETPLTAWANLMQVNVLSVMHLTSLFLKDMIARGSGHVVFLSSTAGFSPTSFQTAYSASKFGVRGFAMALSREVAPFGIDVSIIYPIWSETNMLKSPCYGSRKVLRPPSFFIVKPETIVRASVKGIKKRKLHIYADVFTKMTWWVCKMVPMIGIMPTEPKTNS